jgi:hypothetical protein
MFADNGLSDVQSWLYFPADPLQMDAVINQVFFERGMRFVFSTRSKVPWILKEDGKTKFFGGDYKFVPGKDEVILEGKAGYVVSFGDMLHRSYDAVLRCRQEGLDVGLVNKPTLNLVDEEVMRKIGVTPFVLVVEPLNQKTGVRLYFPMLLELTIDMVLFTIGWLQVRDMVARASADAQVWLYGCQQRGCVRFTTLSPAPDAHVLFQVAVACRSRSPIRAWILNVSSLAPCLAWKPANKAAPFYSHHLENQAAFTYDSACAVEIPVSHYQGRVLDVYYRRNIETTKSFLSHAFLTRSPLVRFPSIARIVHVAFARVAVRLRNQIRLALITPKCLLSSSLSPTMPFQKVDTDELSINTIRTLAADVVNKANSGHPGNYNYKPPQWSVVPMTLS